MPRVFFVAGDLSGDHNAAHVAAHLKSQNPGVEILAIGGPALKKVADTFLLDMVDKSVFGFLEPIKKIPWFWNVLRNVIRPALAEYRPDVVVPTDFFGFNRFTAKAGRASGSQVYYLVSPQVWASRPGRIATLRKLVHRMLVIFPFEEELYRNNGVPVTFIGHPLLDRLPVAADNASLRVEPVVGLLPGSRAGEVKRHLPLFLKAADLLAKDVPGIRFVLFAAQSLSNDFYDSLLGRSIRRPYLLEIVRDEDYTWRSGLDYALTSSGTATLENALLGVPMSVVYKMSAITYQLAKRLVSVKHISMVNILAKKALVPEFIQDRATPENLAAACRDFLKDTAGRKTLRSELLSLRGLLGGPGAGRRAAKEILKAINGRSEARA